MNAQTDNKLSPELQSKLDQLKQYFANKIVIVAYSGGVDSSVLAEAGNRFARKMIAITADSPTVLPGEVDKRMKNSSLIHTIVAIIVREDYLEN
jgi:PP-loop superfamily ATP-utilizing enzyme